MSFQSVRSMTPPSLSPHHTYSYAVRSIADIIVHVYVCVCVCVCSVSIRARFFPVIQIML